MKKLYSSRAGAEVFALAPEQIDVFKKFGYETPSPTEVIADAGAAKLTPPEGKRAYVVFNFKKGEFSVRAKTCTIKVGEVGALVSEIVQAAITARLAENADPDRPKAAPAAKQSAPLGGAATGAFAASPLGAIFGEAIKKVLVGAFTPPASPTAPAAEAPGEEVTE